MILCLVFSLSDWLQVIKASNHLLVDQEISLVAGIRRWGVSEVLLVLSDAYTYMDK